MRLRLQQKPSVQRGYGPDGGVEPRGRKIGHTHPDGCCGELCPPLRGNHSDCALPWAA
jgi:hypothetical protein